MESLFRSTFHTRTTTKVSVPAPSHSSVPNGRLNPPSPPAPPSRSSVPNGNSDPPKAKATPAVVGRQLSGLVSVLRQLVKLSGQAEDLGKAASDLADSLENGIQTPANKKGFVDLKNAVESLNVFVKEIKLESMAQNKLVTKLTQLLNALTDDLEEEADGTLELFSQTDPNSNFKGNMQKIRDTISLLEAEACPDISSYYAMSFDFSGVNIDTTVGGPPAAGVSHDIGCGNSGRQKHVYRNGVIRAPGSVASENHAVNPGRRRGEQ